jgi:hypothetical protein
METIGEPIDEWLRVIFELLLASTKAKPIQEIADEVGISYAETEKYLIDIGGNMQLGYTTLPNGVPCVEIYRVGEEKNMWTNAPDDEI